MGSAHSLTACPIELREDDCASSSTGLPAPSVASTSLSSKVNRCWNCDSEGHRYTQCSRPRRGTFCFRCGRSTANTKSCVSEYCRKKRERESSAAALALRLSSRPFVETHPFHLIFSKLSKLPYHIQTPLSKRLYFLSLIT